MRLDHLGWVWLCVVGLLPAAMAQPVYPPKAATTRYSLEELSRIALVQHPRLIQASYSVEAARGRVLQAGLYPNPFVQITGDELADRQGQRGIWGAPYISQELITGDKMKLSKAAAGREVDQAALSASGLRFTILTEVRIAYFDVLAAIKRVELYRGWVSATDRLVEYARQLLAAKQLAQYEVLQLEATAERARAELAAAEREITPAIRRLAAVTGSPDLRVESIIGTIDSPLPHYTLDETINRVLAQHPEIASAQVGIDRARLYQQKAAEDRIPNLTLYGGYTYQGQNRSHDWAIGLGAPLPLWNRNQGNIQTAQAQVGEAVQGVQLVRSDLINRISAAYREYTSAKERMEGYQQRVRPRLRKAAEMTAEAQKQGAARLRELSDSQSAVWQGEIGYVQSMADAWRAASVLSGMICEEQWPTKAVSSPLPPVGNNTNRIPPAK